MPTPARVVTDKPRRRRPLRIVAAVLAVVLVAGVGVIGWYLIRAKLALDAVPRVDFETVAPSPGVDDDAAPKPTTTLSPEPARPAVASAGTNFLLLGTDDASGGNSRSDSFMVLHINADHTKAYIISYPRDSYVDIPGYGKGKINWAYQWGGVALAKKTIEQLSGVGIDHTLHVDFDGFIGLTEVVGGVTVNNPYAFSTGQYNFPVGDVELSGDKALAYVRNRYNLPHWDLDRAANQRNVVKAIIVKTLKPQVIANPVTFNQLLDKASTCIQVDKGLTSDTVRDLALSMRLTTSDSIVLMQAPISGFANLPNGDSIDVVDQPKMDALSAAIKADTIDDYTAHRLLNGLDDIGVTLQHADTIAAYEATRPAWKVTTLPAKVAD